MFNPFDILGFNVSFDLDLVALDRQYFSRQTLVHPDRFMNKSMPEREAAAQKASDINKAYQLLKNPVTRAEALLNIKKISTSCAADRSFQDPELLLEVMELREEINEAEKSADLDRLEQEVTSQLEACCHNFSMAEQQKRENDLEPVFLRLTYLSKILKSISVRRQQVK